MLMLLLLVAAAPAASVDCGAPLCCVIGMASPDYSQAELISPRALRCTTALSRLGDNVWQG